MSCQTRLSFFLVQKTLLLTPTVSFYQMSYSLKHLIFRSELECKCYTYQYN